MWREAHEEGVEVLAEGDAGVAVGPVASDEHEDEVGKQEHREATHESLYKKQTTPIPALPLPFVVRLPCSSPNRSSSTSSALSSPSTSPSPSTLRSLASLTSLTKSPLLISPSPPTSFPARARLASSARTSASFFAR